MWREEFSMKAVSIGSAQGILTGFLIVCALAGAAGADQPEINMRGPAGWLSSGEEWSHALNGYDPVAYFTEGRPVRGEDAYVSTHRGVPFLFASAEHKALFDEDPSRYVPRFGGYCAYAVSQGSTASGDPLVWTLHEGRLYLNLDEKTQKIWLDDRDEYIEQAERNWPTVLAE